MKPIGKRVIFKPIKKKESQYIEMPERYAPMGIVLYSNNPQIKQGETYIFKLSRVTKIEVSGEEVYLVDEQDIEAKYEA